jgi:hypothetical protein
MSTRDNLSDNFINVRSYGAVGNGTTDDTEAVKNAFNVAAVTGKPLYIPKGEYLVGWGQIVTNITANGIRILGDGMFSSIIKMKTDHNNGAFGNGVILKNLTNASITPDVSISNISIRWDGNAELSQTDLQSRLLGIYGYFGKVYVDNCYFHLSGVEGLMPPDCCVFIQLGAEIISFKDCIFENFTNRQIGGGLWIMPDGAPDSNGVITHYEIKQIIVKNNEFRTSNQDEALTLYPTYSNNNPSHCLRDVLIDGNTFRHKNWINPNANPHKTQGMLTVFVYNNSAPVVEGNIVISNNILESDYADQELIRVVGFTGVDIVGNHITVNKTSLTDPKDQALRAIYFGRDTKGTVRDNYLDYSKITTFEVKLSIHQTAQALWKNNVIITGYHFGISPSASSVVAFEGNTVYPLNNSKFIIRKNNADSRLFVYNNIVYGNTFLNHLYGSNFIVKGNHFNADTGTDNSYSVPTKNNSTGSLDYQMNDGVILMFMDTNVLTKIPSFKYTGKRSDLKFFANGAWVQDSPSVRALFFDSCDITYLG